MSTKYLSLVMAILMCTTMSFAQQVDRVQRGQRGYTPPPLEREAGSKAVVNTLADIDEKMDFYETELPLDAFEKAVLKNMIVDFEETKMAMHADENLNYKVREEQILKLDDQFRIDLEAIFPTEKVDKFYGLYFMDEKLLKKKKKKKRNRKSKKD